MKILWITNIMLPPICKEMNLTVPVVGGWMFSSAVNLLKNSDNIKLAIATTYSGNTLIKKKIESITYYSLPIKGDNTYYHKSLESLWQQVNDDFAPDLVHLHGTEFAHGLAFQRACPNVKTVVSIQGMVSVCARYYIAGITSQELKNLYTIRDVIKRTSILQGQRDLELRGEIEKEILRNTCHIIGRTSWDKAQTWAINPNAQYHFCNETLRTPFYKNKWKYEKCEPHSIFISQAGYPIKGLHQLLKAMPLILREFPDTRVYVAGANIIKTDTLSAKLRLSSYGKYLKSIIEKNHLKSHVVFTGPLNEEEMCQQYLKANVFVCPSSIENSPNSLGEAQLLGMPCIASYVGGTPDMMRGAEEWMYRFEEIEMLADKICKLFRLRSFSQFTKNESGIRHDKHTNSLQLFNIYKTINNDYHR